MLPTRNWGNGITLLQRADFNLIDKKNLYSVSFQKLAKHTMILIAMNVIPFPNNQNAL